MAKKESLPLDELKLLAWRLGIKLGSAIDHHRHAHWHLKQHDSASVKKAGAKPDIHLPFALASEVAMVQDFEACIGLAKTLGFGLAPLEGGEACGRLVRRGNRLTPEDVKWTQDFVEEVDKRVDTAYEGMKGHLRKEGEPIAALFDLAVRASMWITSPDDPANLSRLAAAAGVPSDCGAPFLAALTDKADRDTIRRELAQLDKCVERSLLYGDSAEGGEAS